MFGYVDLKVQKLKDALDKVRLVGETRNLSDVEFAKNKALEGQLQHCLIKRESLNFKFIRGIWDEIKEESYDFVAEFFKTSKFLKTINVTWLTLIPKTQTTCAIQDYKLIIMIGICGGRRLGSGN